MRAAPSRMGYAWLLITEVVDDLLRFPATRLRGRTITASETQKTAAHTPHPRPRAAAVGAGVRVHARR